MAYKNQKLTAEERAKFKESWYYTMRIKLGVATNEEVRAYQAVQGMKATRTGTGGFRHMQTADPNRLKEISSKAGKARWQKQNQ